MSDLSGILLGCYKCHMDPLCVCVCVCVHPFLLVLVCGCWGCFSVTDSSELSLTNPLMKQFVWDKTPSISLLNGRGSRQRKVLVTLLCSPSMPTFSHPSFNHCFLCGSFHLVQSRHVTFFNSSFYHSFIHLLRPNLSAVISCRYIHVMYPCPPSLR